MKKEQKNYRNWIIYLLIITLVISVINFVQISSISNTLGQPTGAVATDGTVNPQPSAPTAVAPPKPVEVSVDDDPAKGDPALAE